MASNADNKAARLQEILTELLKRHISMSLTELDQTLERWRSGACDELDAHADVLRHAARTERIAARMSRVGEETAAPLVRDAFDLGLVDEPEFIELTGKQPAQVEPAAPLWEQEDADDEAASAGARRIPGVGLPQKRTVVDELLAEGGLLLHVDARRDGVSVPEQFRSSARLVLRFGYNLAPGIPDLSIDDDCIAGTLHFGGVPFRCVLPWTSVYAVVSEASSRGLVWPEDVPAEVLDELSENEESSAGALKVLPSEPETEAPAAEDDAEMSKADKDKVDEHKGDKDEVLFTADSTKERRAPALSRAHLRLVK